MRDQRFEYASNTASAVVLGVITTPLGLFCVYMLAQGIELRLNGIELGPTGSVVAWVLLGAVLFGSTALAAAMLALPYVSDRALIITTDTLRVPGPIWSPSHRDIRLAQITSVREHLINGQPFLHVVHRDGHIDIPAMLLSEEGVAAVLEFGASRPG